MASKIPATCWTDRDDEIAACLYRAVRTSEQLLTASAAFQTKPFESLRRVQERLAALARRNWVARRPYRRSIERGSSYYYQLTLAGYRQWRQDDEAQPPTKRYFSERSEPSHHHCYELARFWTATERFAAEEGLEIVHYVPEGAFHLTAGGETIKHDGLFALRNPFGRLFWVFVELDRSTERLTSTRDDIRHWEKILRVYDGVQNHLGSGQRFRVWAPCSESRVRAKHIAQLFAIISSKPNRELVLPFSLADFESSGRGLHEPLVQTAGDACQSLLPLWAQQMPGQESHNLVASLTQAL